MQQDKTVGLALGVLLIGIVAAFFFRHEPLEEDVPELKNAEALDARISEKPLTPYPSDREQEQRDTGKANDVTSQRPWEGENSLSEFPGGSRPQSPTEFGTPAPNPIPFGEETGSLPVAPPVFGSNTRTESRPSATGNSSATREYTVQPGDTLSGLAHRFLGKSSKYLELYRANRDKMKTPDDLRAGMVIRIPGGATVASTPHGSSRPANSQGTRASQFNTGDRNLPVAPKSGTGYPWALTPPSQRPEEYRLPERKDSFPPLREPGPTPRDSRPNSEFDSAPIARPQLPTGQAYRIQPGDSLERIAIRYYGDRSAVRSIYEANRERLRTPNDLPQGLLIVLPEVRRFE